MTVRKLILSAVSMMALAGFLLPTVTHAVSVPCKTAKLIVPWKAGGGTHVIFSIFEKTIQEMDMATRVKVITIPGQGGNKGAKEAQRAKPDGCTLFAIHQSAITSFLNGRIKFSFEAFDTVALLTSTPDIVGAAGDVPWNSFGDLKSAAMAAPDSIKAGATFGSTSQFMWLIMEDLTGMKFSYVPYDGTRERMTALLSGAIQLGTLNVASGRKYIESGELKAFAIAADKRSEFLPDLPTLKELGVPLVYSLKRGIVVPKGTSPDVIEQWSQVFKKAAENPALVKQMVAKGTDVEWVGPGDYRAWAKKTFDEHEKVAIKIGMYKK
ncbi:MAG: tripartite tricarboxylate transporter substrate binding protein [Gammaproteobacteria bacterium]